MKSQVGSRHIKSGFTLIELLLVMAIGAIIAGLSIPVLLRFFKAQLVDDTTRTLQDSLRRAQMQAVVAKDDLPHGVRLTTSTNQYVIFEGTSYAARVTAEDETISYPSTVTITATTTEVVFSKAYGTSTWAGTWTLTQDAESRSLTIGSRGTVDLQ
jgi:prepilin-type N-terminal cleavage/methylation domain-containing protein